MKRLLAPLFSLFGFAIQAAEPNVATLTLTSEGDDNQMEISVAALGTSDAQITTLSGTLEVLLNIDPETGQTDQFIITDGALAASNVNFVLQIFIFSANLNSMGVTGTADTPGGQGPVNPANGTFDASLHTLMFDSGTFSGTALGEPINTNIADSPIFGTGSTTEPGIITLTDPIIGDHGRVDYTVNVTIPIEVIDTIPTGVELQGQEIMADATVIGELKATGTIFTMPPIPTYEEWALDQGLEEDSQSEFSISPVAPNELIYALGYNADSFPGTIFTQTTEGLLVNIHPRGLRRPVTVQYSPNLSNWDTAPENLLFSGVAEIPQFCTTETGVLMSDTSGYYRLILPATPQP